jgi:hypothetical protein
MSAQTRREFLKGASAGIAGAALLGRAKVRASVPTGP